MSLSFNSNGHLHKTVELTLEEFEQHFGTNEWRKQKIRNALTLFEILGACGCTTVFIGGSFISTKINPNDIDLCFDLQNIDYDKLEQVFPDFFDHNKIGEIHRNLKCHVLYFDKTNHQFLHMLEKDKDGYPKGLVKINLKDIFYD
ncbi:hypothetical protein A4H97_28645 [Niastella yeongjuensis]|uniref:Polymerase nucleotidyl transferase domain-containing protein n=1 Tax=Niastella yeongjuensis TaxID=354355 RepID=A0A1V9ETF8_9BACT|nr:hypothetical protein [Niastella yeongjuensis]OQP49312.1 hypothetical protein A4H97_28645 [Niastella yeongjuensis]SEP43169.1 hypothetical protein SAMN05660816_06071 [Niastella yeongjuensis]